MGYVDYNMYEFWQFFLVPRMCKMNVDVSLLPSNRILLHVSGRPLHVTRTSSWNVSVHRLL